jgi:hypothetical protein
MEYRTIKHKRHYVYDDISEFHLHHPNTEVVENWKKANEGDWAYSDDNRILQILKKSGISHPNDRKNYKHSSGYVRTVVGTFLVNPKSYMDADFNQHNNRYTFSKTIKNTNSRVKERENVTKKEKQFATNYVIGMGGTKAFMDAFKESNSEVASKKAAILLRQRRVMQEIEKGALDVAKSLGIDHEYVLAKLKSLSDYSEDDNIILQSTKELAKIIGTSGTIKKETDVVGIFQGFTRDELQLAENREVSSEQSQLPDEVREDSD